MATSITFNNTYTGGQVSLGIWAPATFATAAGYTGSSVLATGTSYKITGTVSDIGSAVTLTTTTGTAVTTATEYYEGFLSIGGNTYYVFSPSTVGGSAFAVSSTGATVSITASVFETLSRSVPSAVCFLSGTRIRTPDGEVAIESLRVGDHVATVRDGRLASAPITWIGHGTGHAGNGSTDDAPVRIRRNAIADAVPHRDLLVTPEHCLHLDGVLVPARMLVNGGSITRETEIGAFEYYHLELENHAILLAEGAEAESYLDTGNRANFRNSDVAALQPAFASPEPLAWSTDAAAPLAVDRETVEPIWFRLAKRAGVLGVSTGTAAVGPDRALDLHILTESGEQILPTLFDGSVFGFVVPAGSGQLRLRSRSARPSDAVGPFVDDRRILGVQVGRIGAGGKTGRASCTAHLGSEALAGWHATEGGNTRRWTDGDAALPVRADADAPLFLDIELVAVGPYAQAA